MPRLMKARIEIRGQQELVALLNALPEKLQRKALRRGVTKGARIVARQAKALAPVETGALKASIGHKVGTFTNKSGVWAVVGPRRDQRGKPARFRVGVVQGKKGLRRAKKGEQAETFRNPANYAHLVEFGHRIASGGTLSRETKHGAEGASRSRVTLYKGGGRATGTVAAKPFLRPAWDATRAQVQAIIAQEAAAELRRARAARPK